MTKKRITGNIAMGLAALGDKQAESIELLAHSLRDFSKNSHSPNDCSKKIDNFEVEISELRTHMHSVDSKLDAILKHLTSNN